MSLLFAASHPDRVAALVVYASLPRFTWAPDFPWMPPLAERERSLEGEIRGPVDRYTELWGSDGGPSEVEDDLVEAVIEQVKAGSLAFGHAGAGTVTDADETDLRVETPFLQLVSHLALMPETLERLDVDRPWACVSPGGRIGCGGSI